MRDFSITEQDVAISKARWEPEFKAFAARSSRILASTRRLPIYRHATQLACDWLRSQIVGKHRLVKNRALLLVGDEHLHDAAMNTLAPIGVDYTHIFPDAWLHWLSTEFRGNPGWWLATHWAINNPVRLLQFAEFDFDDPGLEPNISYLLSTYSGSRGTDSVCRLVNDALIVDKPFCEWVSED